MYIGIQLQQQYQQGKEYYLPAGLHSLPTSSRIGCIIHWGHYKSMSIIVGEFYLSLYTQVDHNGRCIACRLERQLLCVRSLNYALCFFCFMNILLGAYIPFTDRDAHVTTTTTQCMQMDQWSQRLPTIFRHTHTTTTLGSSSYMDIHAYIDAVLYIIHLCHVSYLRSVRC